MLPMIWGQGFQAVNKKVLKKKYATTKKVVPEKFLD
jgi:hypothetical protein